MTSPTRPGPILPVTRPCLPTTAPSFTPRARYLVDPVLGQDAFGLLVRLLGETLGLVPRRVRPVQRDRGQVSAGAQHDEPRPDRGRAGGRRDPDGPRPL